MYNIKFNDEPLDRYNGKCIDFRVGNLQVDKDTFIPSNSIMPVVISKTLKYKIITIDIEFQESEFSSISENISRKNISKLLNLCYQNPTVQFGDDMFYECIFQGSEIEKIVGGFNKLKVTFWGTQKQPEVIQSISNGAIVNCLSTVPRTPIKLTFTPNQDINTLTINENEFYNLQSGVKYILDGDNKTYTSNGNNNFSKCNVITFPYLEPNENTFSINPDIEIQLSYNPTHF